MSAENQSTEIGFKTVFENLNLVKSYNKTNPNVFIPSLWEKYRWGLTSFGQYILYLYNVS